MGAGRASQAQPQARSSREDHPDERKRIAERLALGQVKVICNVATMTTGIDLDVRCIILARPTKSEILFVQIVGRGLRTAPGKEDLVDISADGYESLRIQAEKFAPSELARVIELLLAAQNYMRWTTSPIAVSVSSRRSTPSRICWRRL